jgi:hypothetical protein
MLIQQKKISWIFGLIYVFAALFITKTSAMELSPLEQELYKKYPWELVERVLITDANEEESTSSYLKRAFTAGGISFGVIEVALFCFVQYFVLSSPILSTEKITIPNLITTTMLSFFSSIFPFIFTLMAGKKDFDRISTTLENLLKNYNPNLDESEANNKLYLPEELHPIFDALYDEYKKNGVDALSSDAVLKTVKAIKDQIRYSIKHKKYVRPEVHVSTSNYNFNTH